eukprot:9231204-Pyramimonas_sp.AAC.1
MGGYSEIGTQDCTSGFGLSEQDISSSSKSDLTSVFSDPPARWQAFEADVQKSVEMAGGKIIIADGKLPDKTWVADGPDVIRWLHQTAALDGDWALRLDLARQDAATWLWTRAHAGLPAWLRSPTMLPPVTKATCPP